MNIFRWFKDKLNTKKEKELTFAPNTELIKHWSTAREFVGEILGYDIDGIFVSDLSSIWDFLGNERPDQLYAATKAFFGVDISDLESGNLVEIARRIESVGKH